jgi:hypothetical protein
VQLGVDISGAGDGDVGESDAELVAALRAR